MYCQDFAERHRHTFIKKYIEIFFPKLRENAVYIREFYGFALYIGNSFGVFKIMHF